MWVKSQNKHFIWTFPPTFPFFKCTSWTHSLAPGQSSGVVFFDVVLQLSPDVDIGLHPVHVCLVPVRRDNQEQLISPFCSFFLFISPSVPQEERHATLCRHTQNQFPNKMTFSWLKLNTEPRRHVYKQTVCVGSQLCIRLTDTFEYKLCYRATVHHDHSKTKALVWGLNTGSPPPACVYVSCGCADSVKLWHTAISKEPRGRKRWETDVSSKLTARLTSSDAFTNWCR